MRSGDTVFVDTGAWIALARSRDPLHPLARETWLDLVTAGARLHTSVPVILETFTFLDRNTDRSAALAWKDSLERIRGLEILECRSEDVREAWSWFYRRDLHKLSAVDATSFVLMKRHAIRVAFSFDHHFAMAGFQMVG